ncbi:kinase/pyrophosphorylase [bacterium]|nr:kinase/pyrophosphorylase [bacterium]
MARPVFFISDSTGLTAEAVGKSLLAHFDMPFEEAILSFVDTEQKARSAVAKINRKAELNGYQPIVIETIIDPAIRDIIHTSKGHIVDSISSFLPQLETLLGQPASVVVGRPEVAQQEHYQRRIDAMHYSIDNDDGAKIDKYDQADIILVGVSRSGKTPTSVFLSLQGGVYAANYPLNDDDFESNGLPRPLKPYQKKLYGLTIDPEHLAQIRNNRKANTRYASIRQCEDEVRLAEMLFKRFNIPYIDTTRLSIEEIATRIIVEKGLRQQ